MEQIFFRKRGLINEPRMLVLAVVGKQDAPAAAEGEEADRSDYGLPRPHCHGLWLLRLGQGELTHRHPHPCAHIPAALDSDSQIDLCSHLPR